MRGACALVPFRTDPFSSSHLPACLLACLLARAAQQYTALRIEEGGLCTQRNYSLSSAPGLDHLRITVKRVPASKQGAPAGQVSEYIHDTVAAGHTLQVAVPCGDFFLDDAQLEDDLPLVLLSGGVGITPIGT